MKDQGRFLKKYRGNECLNCSVPLDVIDRYCHNCGQANTTKKLSLKDFFNEYFSSIFSYDSRLRHTMVALLFKPGLISKEYIEGKRIKYANPFRFYLSISIIFFIINGLFIDFDRMSYQMNKKSNFTLTQPTSTSNIIDSFSLTEQKNPNIKLPDYYSETQLDSMSNLTSFGQRFRTYTRYYEKTNELSPENALDSLKHKKSWLNKYLYKRGVKTNMLNHNPIELLEYLFNKLPLIIFFFLPFFALAIWLVYIRKSFTYMEHLIFTFHTQTVFFILIGIAFLIDEITKNETAITIAMFIFLAYLYLAMRKFYQQGIIKTILKFLMVNLFFFTLASIGSIIAIIGAVFIF